MNILFKEATIFLDRKFQKYLTIVEEEKYYNKNTLPEKRYTNGKNRCHNFNLLIHSTNQLLNFECLYTLSEYLKISRTQTKRMIDKGTFCLNENHFTIIQL